MRGIRHNFQHISQNATPATESTPCRHLMQPYQCDSHKTRNTTCLKCCACHEKWQWTRPKCCACHENCNASSENVVATQNDFRRVTKHVWMSRSATPATRNEATHSNATFETSKNDPFCRTYHRHGHIAITRTVANGCEWLRTVANGCGRLRTVRQRRANTPSTPRPPEWNGNPCYAFGKKCSKPPTSCI